MKWSDALAPTSASAIARSYSPRSMSFCAAVKNGAGSPCASARASNAFSKTAIGASGASAASTFASSALISGRGGAGSTLSAAAKPSAIFQRLLRRRPRRIRRDRRLQLGDRARARNDGSSCQPGNALSCCQPLKV